MLFNPSYYPIPIINKFQLIFNSSDYSIQVNIQSKGLFNSSYYTIPASTQFQLLFNSCCISNIRYVSNSRYFSNFPYSCYISLRSGNVFRRYFLLTNQLNSLRDKWANFEKIYSLSGRTPASIDRAKANKTTTMYNFILLLKICESVFKSVLFYRKFLSTKND